MSKASKHSLLLGAHVSISGGFFTAFKRGADIGCSAIQIFTKSNQQWYAKEIIPEEIALFLKTKQEYAALIKTVIAHTAYVINICSENGETEKKSIEGLITEIRRCEQLEIPYLVMHPGTAGKQDKKMLSIH